MNTPRNLKLLLGSLILAGLMMVIFDRLDLETEATGQKIVEEKPHRNLAPAIDNPGAITPAKALTVSGSESESAEQARASAAVQPADAWQLDDASPDLTLALPEGVTVYAAVTIDMEKPYFPEPGEQLAMDLPGESSVRVNVNSSHPNPNGDYSWRGHLDGYGTDYPVVMTYGQNSVFATVTTPQGSYTLESVNGRGWIYKNPSEFELSAPGATDYREIPHSHD